jgi:ATP-dependent Lon protease
MTILDVGTATGEADQDQEGGFRRLPAAIGVLPLRDSVTFPDLVIPLNIGQPRSLELVNDVLRGDRSIVLIAGRDPDVETPGPAELYSIGVLGAIARCACPTERCASSSRVALACA